MNRRRIKAVVSIGGKVIAEGLLTQDERDGFTDQLVFRKWAKVKGRIKSPVVFIGEGDELLTKFELHQSCSRNGGEMWKAHAEFGEAGFAWAVLTSGAGGAWGVTVGAKGILINPPALDVLDAIPAHWLD